MTTSRCHRVCHCRGSLRLILVARTDSRDRESAMPPGRRLLGVGSALRVCGARSGPARPSPGQGRVRVASESSPAAAARVTLPMTSHGGGHHHDSVTGRRTRHSRPGTRGPSQCHDLSHDSNDGSIRSHDGESLSLSLPSPGPPGGPAAKPGGLGRLIPTRHRPGAIRRIGGSLRGGAATQSLAAAASGLIVQVERS
jgi:hypothetical protein